MRKTLTIILLALLVPLTGSKAQGPSATIPCVETGDAMICQDDTTTVTIVPAEVPKLTEEEEAVAALYFSEWMELRQIVSHLRGVQEMVQLQMRLVEFDILEGHKLDPTQWRLDWETGTIRPKGARYDLAPGTGIAF